MKIQIEKQIETHTDRVFEGFNTIIELALKSSSKEDFGFKVKKDKRIQDLDFFIFIAASHVAVHEILPNGEKSERLLLIF